MQLSSPDFEDQGTLPGKSVSAALGGQDVPPVLRFDGVPAEAKSLALTCYDPDAPTGSGFWHWIVVNIPATGGGEITLESLPDGAVVVPNDAGAAGYGGALPPEGDPAHRYIFTLHALECDSIDAGAMPQAFVRFHIMTSEIGRAVLVAKFANSGALAG